MVDISVITSVLGSVKTATDIAKFLKESDTSLEKAEMKLRLADLIGALADAKLQIVEVKELLSEKDQEINRLIESQKIKDSIQYEAPYYWLMKNDKKEGPFCQNCYDNDQKLIRLQGYNNGYWDCKTCKSGYKDSSYDEPGIRVLNSGYHTGFED
jgi:hypothetical protein